MYTKFGGSTWTILIRLDSLTLIIPCYIRVLSLNAFLLFDGAKTYISNELANYVSLIFDPINRWTLDQKKLWTMNGKRFQNSTWNRRNRNLSSGDEKKFTIARLHECALRCTSASYDVVLDYFFLVTNIKSLLTCRSSF